MENGLSYDFGIQIATGVIEGLVQAVAGAAAITGTVYALISASNELDNTLRKNQIAFGGYVNTMKAIEFAADKIASGKSIFDTEDIMSGMRALQAAGLNAKQNFDLINKAANAAGVSFTQMADMVRSGNFKGLADVGIITDRTAISFEKAGMNAQMATRSVMGFIEAANKKGMFDNTIVSLSSILARFREFGHEFIKAVLGDPRDPNGFMYNIKLTLTTLADKFYSVLEKIKMVGTAVGHVLTFIWLVVGDFIKRIWGGVKSLFDISDKTFENFQNKMMSFQLWLEILRVKINSFFDEHGKQIKNILKILAVFWALDIFGRTIISGVKLLSTIETAGGLLSSLGSIAAKIAPGLTFLWNVLSGIFLGLVDAAPAIIAFLGEFLIPILAIGAAVYLIIHYWDVIKRHIGDIVRLVAIFFPALRPILLVVGLIHDNWDKIVRLVKALGAFVIALGKNIVAHIVHAIKSVVDWFSKGFDHLVKWLSHFTIIKKVIDGIKDAFSFISKIWDKISGAFGKALDWISGKVESGTAALNADTAALQGTTTVGTVVSTPGSPTAPPTPGSPAAAPTKVSYPTDIVTGPGKDVTKQVNVNSGAVQIYVGKDSGLNEQQLAAKIKQILIELSQKGDIRTGQLNTNK